MSNPGTKPVLAITMGDPASIGPEIAVKAFADARVREICRPLLVGDARLLAHVKDTIGSSLDIRPVGAVGEARFAPGTIDVLDLANVNLEKFRFGEISAMAGNASFEYVKRAIELALAGEVDGTVTGPINKEAVNLAGHKFAGHTEIYAHFTGTRRYAMLLVEEALRVIHVSTHVSLRQACDACRKARILEVIQLLHEACRQFGIEKPRLGVAGLNPHAGDGGLFGDEEEKEIEPAVRAARELGIDARGPIPGDTLFAKAHGGAYDGCVAMYHDQGHIPFKLVGFQWDRATQKMKSVRGVNITLGLPIIRCSVDHGTAMDVAGKGIASPDAMILACEYAARMARNRGAGAPA